MRKLIAKDIFAFARVLKAINMKAEIEEICRNADTIDDVWSSGYAIIYSLFEKAAEQEAENKVYEFLAGPFEMASGTIANLDLAEFFEKLKILSRENDLMRFFKNAAALMK